MKRLWNRVVTMLQPVSASLVAIAIIAILFGFRAGSLVKGTSVPEREMAASSLQARRIMDNPVNAPYKVAQYSVGKLHRSITSQRLVSGLAAGIMIILFYLIASRLFQKFVAVSGSILFATSSTLLQAGRHGTATMMLLTIFALIVCSYAARFNPRNDRWLILTSLCTGLALYAPGMIYFILAGAIWQFPFIKKTLRSTKPLILAACALILLVALTPIVLSIINTPTIWREYLGLPGTLPPISTMLGSALSVPAGLLIYAPSDPLYRVGHLPLLDVFTAGMFIIGCYTLLRRRSLDRAQLLVGILVISMVWCGLSWNYENSLVLLPFVFLVVTTGIAWFLKKWLAIFPRNPLARYIAFALLGAGVLLSCNFQMQRYFLAWPNAPETRNVFAQR